MKMKNPLFAVRDMAKSIDFYHDVLELKVEQDFGTNIVLTGGLSLQTLDSWQQFIAEKSVTFGGNAGELYFETDDMEHFLERLQKFNVSLVHPLKEHRWGQRVIRFYDPDEHIIEVGEPLEDVCLRFYLQGMTPEQIAVRMDVPVSLVEQWMDFLRETKSQIF